ncbi:LamG-like jellyroll fold domain-containing protein [Gelidibacter salicanalis]|uniref:T9SS type A sorting domain-containing protein n=1 Tax=Gelidibacter salicanalis TaxID=291193 RepID=A0A934KMW4_9FLAO|nr:LamG-like jellyroll fold domain-containing protein [Gelidibacter salicanalis]MBJ7882276.1 T9SS type A sorting domain-containing protein [Gelidibacter salicanalis]
MKPAFQILIGLLSLFYVSVNHAQTCGGNTFIAPVQPTTCTYTYTALGWFNASGSQTSPPLALKSDESICIMASYTGNFDFDVQGSFYVAPGKKYTGWVKSFTSSSVILAAGEINFISAPRKKGLFSGLKVTIGTNGIMSIPENFEPGGSATVNNAGRLNVGGDLIFGGNGSINNYPSGKVIVQGNSSMNGLFNNCGLFELFGSLTSGGGSGLKNLCSMYIHTNMNLNADYTNEGLLILDGTLNFTGSVLTNNNIMVVKNIILNNYSLVGNDITSLLIVRQNAVLSSNGIITGHMYYDMDDGGGFDSVCNNCTQDIDIVINMSLPSTYEEILANCGGDIIVNPFIEKSKLDFDGIDDYVTTPNFINGLNNVTIMAWVLSDAGNSTNMTIAGEDVGCRLWLKNGNKPTFTLTTAANSKTISVAKPIKHNEWHHITGTYESSTGVMSLYIDGVLAKSSNIRAGSAISNSSSTNGNFEIGRRSTGTGSEYFKGDVDEVRVFNTSLSADQIQPMVYQEIKNVDGFVKGKVIDKSIVNITSKAPIAWSNLLAYYPFSNLISNSRTTDFSSKNRVTRLKNITSFQEETAPIPYVTKANGAWTSENTWLHGDVWDIEDVQNNKDYSIVKIEHNITTANSHKNLGLLIDSGKTLTVNGDNSISNSWYLKLDGTLNLMDDSQLIQTENSDLVTSANGKILRRQEGTSNVFWYNYWASPVGVTGATTLTNNNASTNNPNNTTFSLNLLKEGNSNSVQFTSAHDAVGKISTRWLYTYKNGLTYWDWARLSPTTAIPPGVGYSQKGTGNSGNHQQYIFEGKPNNGTILVPVTDVGGLGSVATVSKTDYLLGNPYPSALDISKFIDDNIGIINGSIQLWQQWSGSSHYLNEYAGGYATVNKFGSVRAFQFVGIEGATNGNQDGTKIPTKFLPVGQAFMTEIIGTGNVTFKNSQRVFKKEADADGYFNNGSTFFRNGEQLETIPVKNIKEDSNVMSKIRLELNSVNGPATKKELLLGFSNITTDEYDYGYDAKNTTENANDFNLILDNQNMMMQAYAQISNDKVVPLNFKSAGDYTFEIKMTEIEAIAAEQDIYLKDNFTNVYHSLKSDQPYNFTTTSGEFKNRFEVVFQNNNKLLGVSEFERSSNLTYFNSTSDKLFIKGLKNDVSKLMIINMYGQTVVQYQNLSSETLNHGLNISNVASGAYIVYFATATTTKSEKIIID